jgi:hypothetical protein
LPHFRAPRHLFAALPEVPSTNLDIPIIGQLAPAKFALGDALEPGALEIISLDAPLGGGPLREQPLEHAPRHPDHAVVLANLDLELHGLPLGIPRAFSGKVKNIGVSGRGALSEMFSIRSAIGLQWWRGALPQLAACG